MKIRILLTACACIFLTKCATYYHMADFTIPKSTYYTPQERELLGKTTKSIEFDYGYDPDLELDYVFPLYKGFTEFKPADKELSQVLQGVDPVTLRAYNEKIYRLKTMTALRMEQYRSSGKWNNYTLINKYILPPIDFYSSMMEKQAIKKDKDYINTIEKKKKSIYRDTKYQEMKKEFEEIWKNDYNS